MRSVIRRCSLAGGPFLLAFGLTCAAVGILSGIPDLGPLDDKLRYFEADKDAYDLVFVGSSRVYRGVVPEIFDAELRKGGVELRSFNFGVLGMQPHEASALVRRVLEMEPARLRWVVVEPGTWDPVIPERNRFKRRAIFWHDARETQNAVVSTLLLDDSPAARFDLLVTHGLHFSARTLSIGRGFDAARALAGQDRDSDETQEIARWQGFKPYTEPSYQHNPLRKLFLRQIDEYEEMVHRLDAANAEPVSLEGYNVAALEAQVAEVRAAGAEPVYLVTPTPQATPELYELHRRGTIPNLLAFNRPAEYPELFQVERRFDREHLTQEGAELFTRLLAERFAAEVF